MVKPTVISTFAGGGGSSLGYKWAGYDELLAIDNDLNSCETLKANFPELTVWQRDITTVQVNEILQQCKIKVGQLSILDGSPPCQGFSTAGKRNLNDSRNDLFKDFVRLIDGLQPKVFVMENVSGMIKGGYKGKFNEILQTLKDAGYNVKCKLMNAMWYEVPQSRERVFFIGVRDDLNIAPSYPEPLKTFITVKEAFRDVKYEKATYPKSYQEWSKQLKPMQTVSDIHPKGFGFNMIKLDLNKPAPTVTKTHTPAVGLLHPTEDRFCSIPEVKRLCSFPDNYIFLNSTTEFNYRSMAWSRMGNAVMPKMMYHIAKHIKETVFKNGIKTV